MSRNLKYFAGYAIFREYRYNAHRRQNEQKRHPHPDAYLGYIGWSFFWLVMSGLSAIWFALFWPLSFLVFAGFCWQFITWLFTIRGFQETYRKNH